MSRAKPGAQAATVDAPTPPSRSDMQTVLGAAYPGFQALVRRGGDTIAEWRRYSKRSPWVLKVSQGKRTLFYARPDSGKLKVTVLLGPRAVEAALAGQVSRPLHAAIREAREFPEGRPVSVSIRRPADLARIEELLAVKLAARARSGKSKPRERRRRASGRS